MLPDPYVHHGGSVLRVEGVYSVCDALEVPDDEVCAAKDRHSGLMYIMSGGGGETYVERAQGAELYGFKHSMGARPCLRLRHRTWDKARTLRGKSKIPPCPWYQRGIPVLERVGGELVPSLLTVETPRVVVRASPPDDTVCAVVPDTPAPNFLLASWAYGNHNSAPPREHKRAESPCRMVPFRSSATPFTPSHCLHPSRKYQLPPTSRGPSLVRRASLTSKGKATHPQRRLSSISLSHFSCDLTRPGPQRQGEELKMAAAYVPPECG